jgi:hypothetical protein
LVNNKFWSLLIKTEDNSKINKLIIYLLYILHHCKRTLYTNVNNSFFLSFFPHGSTVVGELRRLLMGVLKTFSSTAGIGLLGWEARPSQGLYLHKTAQHRKTRTNTHASSGIWIHNRSIQVVKTNTLDRAANVIGINNSYFIQIILNY